MFRRLLHRPLTRAAVGFALLLSFAVIIIAAGHGAAPVGLLLVLGSPDAWLLPQFFGWCGVALEVFAVFRIKKNNWKLLGAASLATLLVSIVAFVLQSETLRYILELGLFMIPFVLMTILRIAQLLCATPLKE